MGKAGGGEKVVVGGGLKYWWRSWGRWNCGVKVKEKDWRFSNKVVFVFRFNGYLKENTVNLETQPKRQRGQEHEQHENLFSCQLEATKRHKTCYNQILSILEDNTEDEHQETNQDLTDFFTSLQKELLFSDPLPKTKNDPEPNVKEEAEDEDKEMVIRHLLEASDDELGIPNRVANDDVLDVKNDGFPVSLSYGLLELEDDVANY
nr:hypothetical protein [Tanacetum cinerariifolium]